MKANRVIRSLRIDADLDAALRERAWRERTTWTALVVRLLAKAMKVRKA